MLFHEDSHVSTAHPRPAWMPHPGLIVFIGLLWVLAGVAQAVPPI
jgi:hypothetical protein